MAKGKSVRCGIQGYQKGGKVVAGRQTGARREGGTLQSTAHASRRGNGNGARWAPPRATDGPPRVEGGGGVLFLLGRHRLFRNRERECVGKEKRESNRENKKKKSIRDYAVRS